MDDGGRCRAEAQNQIHECACFRHRDTGPGRQRPSSPARFFHHAPESLQPRSRPATLSWVPGRSMTSQKISPCRKTSMSEGAGGLQ